MPDYDGSSDEALMVLARRMGDEAAFDALYHRHARRVYQRILRATGDAQAAEDLNQQVWVKIWVRCIKFDEGRLFRRWLAKIVSNTIIDWQRRQRRRNVVQLGVVPEDWPGVWPDATSEIRNLVAHLFRRLSKRERHAVFLRFCRKLTLEQIADVLRRLYPDERWNPDKVRALLTGALATLLRVLKEQRIMSFSEVTAAASAL